MTVVLSQSTFSCPAWTVSASTPPTPHFACLPGCRVSFAEPSTSVASSSTISAACKQWWVQPWKEAPCGVLNCDCPRRWLRWDTHLCHSIFALLPLCSTTEICRSHFLTYLISIAVHLSKPLWVASFSINLVKTLITTSSIHCLLDLL